MELIEEMLASCQRNDLTRIRFLLSLDSTLVISSNMDGMTCLHVTCLAGNESLTDFLLDKGANVHARTVDGSTPLCEAAAGGWTNLILKLVQHGAVVNPSCQLISPLHEAAVAGKTECCRLLIRLGANLNKSDCWYGTPLHAAVYRGHVRTAKALLDAGANINAKKIHATPLHYACERGHMAMIVLLLMYGADVYCLNNNERRPSALLPEDHAAIGVLQQFEKQPRTLAFLCRSTALAAENSRRMAKEQPQREKVDVEVEETNRTMERTLRETNYPRLLIDFLMHGDTEELVERLMTTV